jgi:acetylornithine deacetylase
MITPTLQQKMRKVLKELIQIESVNPSLVSGGSGEKKIAEYIHAYMKKLGIKTIKQNVVSNRFNVIGILSGKGSGKTLLLNGHMDTVGITGMEIDPLKARDKNGYISGRGSADMKSGISAMLASCEAILSSRIILGGDVIFSFVIDEEYKSIGTEKLLEAFNAQGAIVCEPTDLKIGLAHKGFVWADVNIFGKSAHGSRPEEGIDAIMKAGKFLCEIDNLGGKKLNKKRHPLLGYPSVHCSTIIGGKELSTYPDFCRIQLERRTVPGETRYSFKNELDEIIKKLKSGDQTFDGQAFIRFERPPLVTGMTESIVKSLREAYQKVLEKKPVLGGISWWMDSALISSAGIPAVAFGPAGKGLHGAEETVDFRSVVKTASVLTQTIFEFCQS